MTKININKEWTYYNGKDRRIVTLPHTPKEEILDVYDNYRGVFYYEKN